MRGLAFFSLALRVVYQPNPEMCCVRGFEPRVIVVKFSPAVFLLYFDDYIDLCCLTLARHTWSNDHSSAARRMQTCAIRMRKKTKIHLFFCGIWSIKNALQIVCQGHLPRVHRQRTELQAPHHEPGQVFFLMVILSVFFMPTITSRKSSAWYEKRDREIEKREEERERESAHVSSSVAQPFEQVWDKSELYVTRDKSELYVYSRTNVYLSKDINVSTQKMFSLCVPSLFWAMIVMLKLLTGWVSLLFCTKGLIVDLWILCEPIFYQ